MNRDFTKIPRPKGSPRDSRSCNCPVCKSWIRIDDVEIERTIIVCMGREVTGNPRFVLKERARRYCKCGWRGYWYRICPTPSPSLGCPVALVRGGSPKSGAGASDYDETPMEE